MPQFNTRAEYNTWKQAVMGSGAYSFGPTREAYDKLFGQLDQQFSMAEATDRLNSLSSTAERRYNDLTDISSPYNRGLLNYYMKIMQDAAPTPDQIAGQMKNAGLDNASSATVAMQADKAIRTRASDQGVSAFMKAFLTNEQLAQGYLGQSASITNDVAGNWLKKYGIDQEVEQQNAERDASFWNSMLNMGGGLLGMGLFGGKSGTDHPIVPSNDYMDDVDTTWMENLT